MCCTYWYTYMEIVCLTWHNNTCRPVVPTTVSYCGVCASSQKGREVLLGDTTHEEEEEDFFSFPSLSGFLGLKVTTDNDTSHTRSIPYTREGGGEMGPLYMVWWIGPEGGGGWPEEGGLGWAGLVGSLTVGDGKRKWKREGEEPTSTYEHVLY